MTTPLWMTRLAVGLWLTALIVIAAAISRPNKVGKLYPTFVEAGRNFSEGLPLYGEIKPGQDQYRYSPAVAAAFAPWTVFPTVIGGILWRWLQAAFLLWALRRWGETGLPPAAWPPLFLLALPLVGGNVNNGQLNPLVLALMLCGLTAFQRERLWLAAFALAAATLFKIYPAALGLLLVIVEPRRFPLRFMLALAVGIALPFLVRDADYMQQQYRDWSERLGGDDRSDLPLPVGYHDFQKVLRIWGMPLSLTVYRGVEVVAGGMMAAFLLWGRLGNWDRARSVQMAGSLGFVWVTLFGPATETATYCLLAATASHAVLAVSRGLLWEKIVVWGAYFLFLSSTVSFWFPPQYSDHWRALSPQSHGSLLLLFWIVRSGLRRR